MKENKIFEIYLTEQEELKMKDIFDTFWIEYKELKYNLLAQYADWWYIKVDHWWDLKEWCENIL